MLRFERMGSRYVVYELRVAEAAGINLCTSNLARIGATPGVNFAWGFIVMVCAGIVMMV